MTQTNTELHVMCGVQGSGKTTLSNLLALQPNSVLYCYDTFPKERWDDDTHTTMYTKIAHDLCCYRHVICDDLNLTKISRLTLLEVVSDIPCKKILHVMKTSYDVCFERLRNREKNKVPKQFLDYYIAQYEAPSLDEGWDEIIYH